MLCLDNQTTTLKCSADTGVDGNGEDRVTGSVSRRRVLRQWNLIMSTGAIWTTRLRRVFFYTGGMVPHDGTSVERPERAYPQKNWHSGCWWTCTSIRGPGRFRSRRGTI